MTVWTFGYDDFKPEEEGLREALTTVGNGFFCTRGAAEWASAEEPHYPGTYMAGGYNRLITEMQGVPVENEDLVNMPNWLCLTFRINQGKWFHLADVTLSDYRHELDLKAGVMIRRLRFTLQDGREMSLTSRRLISMAREHQCGIEWELTAHGWSDRITIRSALDGNVVNWGVKRYRDLAHRHLDPLETKTVGDDGIALEMVTLRSRIRVGLAARTRVFVGDQTMACDREGVEINALIGQDLSFDLPSDTPVRVEKLATFSSSKDHATFEPLVAAVKEMQRLTTFADMLDAHALAWHHLWKRCDIELASNPDAERILKLHMAHQLQTTSRHTVDLDVGVPARGWHGEAYRGHIFWDELYIFPTLNFRVPEITRSLLLYRYRRLDEARGLAKAAGYRGAMFPWQSGSDGSEETQTVHLNPKSGRWLPDLSHNQRHVSAAIAYNIWQYVQTTGDWDSLDQFGAEMLFEITRFWASIAHFNTDRGRYEIHGVMGPDEFHEQYPDSEEHGLKNNAYTNVCVAWIMEVALKAMEALPPDRRVELRETLGIDDNELALWRDMSTKMFVPFHDDGIISQFEGYEKLKELDWSAYREKYGDIHRLDRILEAEGDSANRYKLAKQADTLMLFYLFSLEELEGIFKRLGYDFDAAMAPKNIAYYAERTSHGSTLSHIVHAAITVGHDPEKSWQMFLSALSSDVTDIQGGTTQEGIHMGVMAGTIDSIQRGFLGVEIHGDDLHFNPLLPDCLNGLKVRLLFRRNWFNVELKDDKLRIGVETHHEDATAGLAVRGERVALGNGVSRTFAL